jgi:crotonobetainyl-CoA:carnitine CoA-transferase CaiB-like acyl-CoA transferase
VGNDSQFTKFCEAAGRTEWAQDARFATNSARVRSREVLVPLIADVVRTRSQHDWLAVLEARGVPCGPINRLDQVFADPQLEARGLRRDLAHPLAGTVPQVVAPLKLSGTPLAFDRPPPLLGQDTADVLSSRLGFDAARLQALAEADVIGLSAPGAAT